MAAWGADGRYTRLVEQRGGALLHFAFLLTGNRHDAEDIVQEAIISAAAAWPIVQPTSGAAYLKKAVANRAIDLMRRRREFAVEDVQDTPIEDVALLRLETDQRFFALLASLPAGQREIIVLRYFGDMSDRVIADSLGITIATVRSQAQRALSKLRSSTAEILQGRY